MEQRLDATYLRPGLTERTIAVGICAACVGTGIFLAAWGISFLWRYTPSEIAVRIANPEIHIAQGPPLKVIQDKPFVIEQPEPPKVDTPVGHGAAAPKERLLAVGAQLLAPPLSGVLIV
jgi:hypothetical protein